MPHPSIFSYPTTTTSRGDMRCDDRPPLPTTYLPVKRDGQLPSHCLRNVDVISQASGSLLVLLGRNRACRWCEACLRVGMLLHTRLAHILVGYVQYIGGLESWQNSVQYNTYGCIGTAVHQQHL